MMWLSVVGAVVVYWFAKELWMRWKYDIHRIPSPAGVPFFGHAFYFMGGARSKIPMYKRILQWHEALGRPKVMNLRLRSKNFLVVMDADFTRDVVYAKQNGLNKPVGMREDSALILTGNSSYIPSATAERATPYVKAVRRGIGQCMNSASLKRSVPQLRTVVDRAMQIVDVECKKGPVDVEDLFTRMTLDLIGEVGLGWSFGALDRSQKNYELIIACGRHIRDLLLKPLLKLQFKLQPNATHTKQMKSDFHRIVALWDDVATDIRKRPVEAPTDAKPMWAALRDVRDPETDGLLPVELLRGEVGTLVLAGMDSTGHSLGWAFALLATYPHVVEKILDELKSHGLYGDGAREVEFDDLSNLDYLTAAIKEAMHMGYVNIFISRKCTDKDMDVLGYRVPKGTHFFIPSMPMMNTDDNWDEPMEFKPERWLRGEDMSQKYYFPFAAGERDCIGQRFAMLVMKLAMTKFVSTYFFRLTGQETFESLYETNISGLVIESRNGIRLHIELRN